MAQKLAGKVAVVTGASKGIGASIAKYLAAEGASVVVNYASGKEDGERVASEIVAAGGKAIAVHASVTKRAELERLFSETRKVYGAIDILVNNAGVYEFLPIEAITEEHFHRQFDTNVLGLLLATQEALKHLNPAGGSVINISSMVSTFAPPQSAVYTATKSAVDGITKVLSKELGPRKIRVNSINPGMVVTEGTKAAGFLEGDFRAQIESQTPLGRIGQPQDIATAVVFLASDDSSWVSGESLIIAGGLR